GTGGACGALGNPCSSGDECCVGFCAEGRCVPYCKDQGTPCMSPAACCSGRCNGGVCGNLSFSLLSGDACPSGAGCKSYSCSKGYCSPNCGVQGQACTSEAQ